MKAWKTAQVCAQAETLTIHFLLTSLTAALWVPYNRDWASEWRCPLYIPGPRFPPVFLKIQPGRVRHCQTINAPGTFLPHSGKPTCYCCRTDSMSKLESMCRQEKASGMKYTRVLTGRLKLCLAHHAGRLDLPQLHPQTNQLSRNIPFTHKALSVISVCAPLNE